MDRAELVGAVVPRALGRIWHVFALWSSPSRTVIPSSGLGGRLERRRARERRWGWSWLVRVISCGGTSSPAHRRPGPDPGTRRGVAPLQQNSSNPTRCQEPHRRRLEHAHRAPNSPKPTQRPATSSTAGRLGASLDPPEPSSSPLIALPRIYDSINHHHHTSLILLDVVLLPS